ncbi:hypothetical protein BGZ83_001840 [Gryganskiella cystojenkinii]|nr:hypothetical protein BGZ83_001840 [Gryganskiella cystojenkinii]
MDRQEIQLRVDAPFLRKTKIKAMAFPEIQLRVGDFLSQPDLYQCIQVCKEWHTTYIPLFYQSLHLRINWGDNNDLDDGQSSNSRNDDDSDSHNVPKSCKRPSDRALGLYATLVKDLTIGLPNPSACDLASLTTNVERLRIDSVFTVNGYLEAGLVGTARILITYLPRIRKLELCRFSSPMVARCLERIGEVCSELRELQLEHVTFNFPDIVRLINSCPRLSSLSITDCRVFGTGSNNLIFFPRIKALKLFDNVGLNLAELVDWAAHCSALETLVLKAYLGKDGRNQYVVIAPTPCKYSLLSQHCPNLSSFELTNLEDEDSLTKALVGCKSLKNLTLKERFIREAVYWASASVFHAMTTLDLLCCDDFEGWMCKKVLHSCPSLVFISVNRFEVDVVLAIASGPTLSTDAIAASVSADTTAVLPQTDSGATTITVAQKKEQPASSALTSKPSWPSSWLRNKSDLWICKDLVEFQIFSLVWSKSNIRNRQLEWQRAALKRLKHFVIVSEVGDKSSV